MLVPLTRQAFEQIVPAIATGPQYAYYWGTWQEVLRRLLISVVALTGFWLLGKLLGSGGQTIKLIFDIVAGLYWLWGPVYWASRRNAAYRRFAYSGFWRGRVLEVYLTEELIGEEETVNQRGELVVIENRERYINVEVGDREGFSATVQTPLRRIYRGIKRGQVAEMLILSQQDDLSLIDKITDVYLPQLDLWIGEYPYLRRDAFKQIREELGGKEKENSPPKKRSRNLRRRK